MTVSCPYSIGCQVEVFCTYCPWVQHRKFMVSDSFVAGTQWPRIVRSDGWVKAVVTDTSLQDPRSVVLGGPAIANSILQCPARKIPESGPWVKVKYLDKIWVDKDGAVLSEKSLFQWIDVTRHTIRLIPVIPKISALVVRWGGERQIDEKRFDFAVGDKLIQEVMDELHAQYEFDVEIFTVFISHTSQLRQVSEIWASAAIQNGTHKVGFYFLWGSNNDRKPGYVLTEDLVDLMERMESVGIVTRYPNHSGLYKIITSKEYQPMLCGNPDLGIPATLAVPVSKLLSIDSVFPSIKSSLISLRETLHQLPPSSFAGGVVKVGNEWMGDGVRVFSNFESDIKIKALSMVDGLHGKPKCLLFQDRIPVIVCEPRVFVYNGEIKEIRYTWNEKLDKVTGRVHAMRTCHSSRAAEEKFQGDIGAQQLVESEIRKIVASWLVWLQCVSGETPVFVRIDFLIEDLRPREDTQTSPPTPSTNAETLYSDMFRVWTCELGEIGSSMVGFREGRQMLFKAIAESCAPKTVLENKPVEKPVSVLPSKPKRAPPTLE
jgi:hypothetical protein